jgi:hypothetical protein
VDPDDPVAVASIVKELASDRDRLARMGKRAFEAAGEFARHKELQNFRCVIEGVA